MKLAQRFPIFALLLILPTLEYLFLRLYLRNFLSLRVGWPSMADWDYIIPGFVGITLYLFLLDLAQPLRIQLRRSGLFVHILSLITFLVFCHWMAPDGLTTSTLAKWIWWLLAITTFSTSFGIWLSGSEWFRNPNAITALPCFLIAIAIPLQMTLLSWLWPTLRVLLGNQTCFLLSILLGKEYQCFSTPQGTTLRGSGLDFIIGQGCSGVDGLVFALLSFLVYVQVNRSGVKKPFHLYAGALVSNLILFHYVNLLRIVLLSAIGAVTGNREIVIGLFHTHAGWILYVIAQYGFLRVFHFYLKYAPNILQKASVAILVVLGLGAVVGIVSASDSRACAFECTSSFDCDNSGSTALGCPACDCGLNVTCAPCALMWVVDCEGCDNNRYCRWTGSACESLTAIPEVPAGMRTTFLGLLCLLPALVIRRRH